DQTGWMAEGSGSTYFVEPTTSVVTEFKLPPGSKRLEIKYGNVSFTYNGVFGSKVQADTVFAVSASPDNPFQYASPAYTDFTFVSDDVGDVNQFLKPHISIYPVSEYQRVNDQAKTRIPDLNTLLNSANIKDEIPVLPPANAAQVFHSNV